METRLQKRLKENHLYVILIHSFHSQLKHRYPKTAILGVFENEKLAIETMVQKEVELNLHLPENYTQFTKDSIIETLLLDDRKRNYILLYEKFKLTNENWNKEEFDSHREEFLHDELLCYVGEIQHCLLNQTTF
jgi:hypothetical protein